MKQLDNNKLFSGNCEFIVGAVKEADFPLLDIPEIAFIGRSNVGKSSLINALLNRKSMARVSNTPGRTREINFFLLGQILHLVDLPGYGYAEASKKTVSGWNRLILDYLRGRRQLKRIFMLIDARHGFKPNDIEMLEFLGDFGVLVQVILTKGDKVSAKQLDAIQQKMLSEIKKHAVCFDVILTTSSERKEGIDEVRDQIVDLI
jgi:GTP-binding protein